ncbi:hypothetical protein ACWF9G_02405 [Nocardia sp. NPDC055029]
MDVPTAGHIQDENACDLGICCGVEAASGKISGATGKISIVHISAR